MQAKAIALARRLAAALLLACVAGAAGAQVLKLEPVDDGAGDGAWLAIKARLLAAAEARDRRALLALVDPQIDNGRSHRRGATEFARLWELDKATSPLWGELTKALTLGSAHVKSARGTQLCAPYVAVRWPAELDRFNYGAIVSRDVLVKDKPSSSARTVARLTHEVIEVDDWEVADESPGFAQRWVRVLLKSAAGYVPEEQIRSAVEHRACFARGPAGWRMTLFAPGVD